MCTDYHLLRLRITLKLLVDLHHNASCTWSKRCLTLAIKDLYQLQNELEKCPKTRQFNCALNAVDFVGMN